MEKKGLTKDEIQDLADIVFHELCEAERQVKKYTTLIASYVTVPDFVCEGVTLKQAENCAKLFAGRVNHYQELFTKLKELGAE